MRISCLNNLFKTSLDFFQVWDTYDNVILILVGGYELEVNLMSQIGSGF